MILIVLLPISNFICFRSQGSILSCAFYVTNRHRAGHYAIYVRGTSPSSPLLVPVVENVRKHSFFLENSSKHFKVRIKCCLLAG